MQTVTVNLYSAITFLLHLPLIIFLSGCCSYKIPTEQFEGQNHWLYAYIPRHRSQIKWYDAGHWGSWMLFGNDDDGIFGPQEYKPDEKESCLKALKWGLRNPLHNFCFYVVGTAYCQNDELTLINLTPNNLSLFEYSKEGKNFGADQTSLFIALHGWKPFISLRIWYTSNYRGEFYAGWRERGNFGICCVPLTSRNQAGFEQIKIAAQSQRQNCGTTSLIPD